jgi:hypothetical protein
MKNLLLKKEIKTPLKDQLSNKKKGEEVKTKAFPSSNIYTQLPTVMRGKFSKYPCWLIIFEGIFLIIRLSHFNELQQKYHLVKQRHCSFFKSFV